MPTCQQCGAAFGAAPLALVLLAALVTSLRRPFRELTGDARRRLAAFGLAAWLAQAAHFAEETATGFWREFPAVLGAAPWDRGAFVLFNLFWLALWAISLWAAVRGVRPAEWPLWFLGLALVLNGVAHPALAAARGGYFPGLWSAPVAAIAGAFFVAELVRASRPRPA